jgi:CheY-like chemotaxis protein
MRPRALVVEDDPVTQRLLADVLEAEGADVDTATDGSEAIDLLTRFEYRIILLDIVLPTVSGADVMSHLEDTNPDVLRNVIVVTGVDVKEIRKLFPNVRDAWGKPVLPARLRATARTVLPGAGVSVA